MDAEQQSFQLAAEHLGGLDELELRAFGFLIDNGHIFPALVGSISRALPDPSIWRAIVTGDLVRSVSDREEGVDSPPYTLNRGAGQVGARTMARNDSTFDLLFSARSFLYPQREAETPEAFASQANNAASHLGVHESGHVVLRLRREDADSFEDGAVGDLSERAWRKHLAAHIDDFRIERAARQVSPSPFVQADHLPDAIDSFRAALNEASTGWRVDLGAAILSSLTAANSLLRVLAYFAAEVETPGSLGTLSPDAPPAGWQRYVEPIWEPWCEILYRLPSSDEPVGRKALEDSLSNLCALVPLWLEKIGVEWELLDEEGRASCFWTAQPY